MDKKRIFSGIQPSGNLHIGNYLGAIKNWVELQNEYESIFCVVDMHAITVPQDPEKLRQKTIEIAKIYLAAGIDPKKSIIFIQSHVKAHAELCWILNTISNVSELERMTQFKDKAKLDQNLLTKVYNDLINSENNFHIGESFLNEFSESVNKQRQLMEDCKDQEVSNEANINMLKNFSLYVNNSLKMIDVYKYLSSAYKVNRDIIYKISTDYAKRDKAGVGLFDYPVLMAADIILYDTITVPVGEDQVQHVELARTLARRFNKRFGDTFIVPEYFVKEEGMRIMGLDNPEKKMSKSAESEYNYISLVDSADDVRRKIRKAVTDSGEEIVYRDDKPALKNLINIYALLANISTQEVEQKFAGKRYGDFKNELAEVVVEFLEPFQARMAAISDAEVLQVLHDGAKRAEEIAEKKMRDVKEKVGFII